MMAGFVRVGALCLLFTVVSGFDVWNLDQLEQAKKTGQKLITVKDLHVPAGKTLDFQGLNGTTIEFAGRVTFGYQEWRGPLIIIKGARYTVKGLPGHLIDGEGHRWWDTLGGNGGKKKPGFIYLHLEDSYVKDLKFKNAPAHGFAVNACRNLHIENVDIDNADGHTKGGHNTDGFDVAHCQNVKITGCRVNNQDDCLALSSGKNVVFTNNVCIGGHGIAVIGGYDGDNVEDILIKDCKVIKNNIGVRVKTMLNGKGLVKGVTFDNIQLQDISETGIVVIGNYLNSGPRGQPTRGCPIQNLQMTNIYGNVLKNGTKHLVWVADDASNWTWNSKIQGGDRLRPCQGIPKGVNVVCGK
uniref:endo-polygalacturonase n=1 Tax=Lygus lineolaris TaxID=50650 RepID=A0A126CSW1_LYGLI|nr:polygalacturonase 19b [Lygus lineolaris]